MEKRVCKLEFKKDDPKSVSKTQQHFKKECDINNIIARYKKTGLLGNPLSAGRRPFYGDFSKIGSLQESLDIVIKAKSSFERLPASTKAKFNNDPATLLAFVSDDKNVAEAVKLGLLPASRLPKEAVKDYSKAEKAVSVPEPEKKPA